MHEIHLYVAKVSKYFLGPIQTLANKGLHFFCNKYNSFFEWWAQNEQVNETSVFHSAPNRARGKRSRNSVSSAAHYAFNSFFLSRARHFTTFLRNMIWQIFT